MGRRALPKIDPSLDFSPWLLEEEQLPAQLPDASRVWSLGSVGDRGGERQGIVFGTGDAASVLSMTSWASRLVANTLVSRQRDWPSWNAANGKLVRGDGVRIFSQRVRSDSVAAVHVYFPDPWWKTRHRKRRVMNKSFLSDVQRVLRVGGVLHFWTDVQEYYESTLKLIVQATDLQGPDIAAAELAAHDIDYRTHFERRTRLHNLPVYRSQFRKA